MFNEMEGKISHFVQWDNKSGWLYKNGSTVDENESLRGVTNYEELIWKIFGPHWNIYFCSYFKRPCLSVFLWEITLARFVNSFMFSLLPCVKTTAVWLIEGTFDKWNSILET